MIKKPGLCVVYTSQNIVNNILLLCGGGLLTGGAGLGTWKCSNPAQSGGGNMFSFKARIVSTSTWNIFDHTTWIKYSGTYCYIQTNL